VDRFVMNTAPVLCVLAAAGAFAIRDLVTAILPWRTVGVLVVAGACAAGVAVYRAPKRAPGDLDLLRYYRDTPASLDDARVRRMLAGRPDDVVLTCDPWRVAAVLDVATVMCPNDGAAAVDAVMERYRPRYVHAGIGTALAGLANRKRGTLREMARTGDAVWYEVGTGSTPTRRGHHEE
jgi:hypothetical protein